MSSIEDVIQDCSDRLSCLRTCESKTWTEQDIPGHYMIKSKHTHIDKCPKNPINKAFKAIMSGDLFVEYLPAEWQFNFYDCEKKRLLYTVSTSLPGLFNKVTIIAPYSYHNEEVYFTLRQTIKFISEFRNTQKIFKATEGDWQ
jgi:hypothetical protein